MKSATFEIPTMYGDHHVIQVRSILLSIPGVAEVNASSAFQLVEVKYDPAVVNDLEIALKLDEAGYLGEWSLPLEPGKAAYQKEGVPTFFRHTTVFETAKQVVGFAQDVNYAGRPLWHCPGMGVIKNKMEE